MKELNDSVLTHIKSAAIKFLYREVKQVLTRLGPASEDDQLTILTQLIDREDVEKVLRDLCNTLELLNLFGAILDYSHKYDGVMKQ